jgi:hypothetical protein
MKGSLKCIPVVAALLLTLFSFNENDRPTVEAKIAEPVTDNIIKNNNTMKTIIGSEYFTATLLNNATANVFKSLLPLSAPMSELNKNEKYFNLANGCP